ncbi:MAG: hypothetical protein ACM3SS_19645 [Rhodospirillaceae bacterium]
MDTSQVLAKIEALGVTVNRYGSSISATPKNAVTPEILALLRQHKPALLVALPDRLAELAALINRYADYQSFPEHDRTEALETSLKNPGESLALWRRLVGEIKDAPPVEECGNCPHIDMRHEKGLNGVRRFWWACAKGHAPLVLWTRSERVLTRPNDCLDYQGVPR